jgi:hypothetical protein
MYLYYGFECKRSDIEFAQGEKKQIKIVTVKPMIFLSPAIRHRYLVAEEFFVFVARAKLVRK